MVVCIFCFIKPNEDANISKDGLKLLIPFLADGFSSQKNQTQPSHRCTAAFALHGVADNVFIDRNISSSSCRIYTVLREGICLVNSCSLT